MSLLSFLIFTPLVGSGVLFFITETKLAKKIGLYISLIPFLTSLVIWVLFDECTGSFQFLEVYTLNSFGNLYFTFGIDGISLFFVLLTTLLVPLCFVNSWHLDQNSKSFLIAFLFLESFILIVFLALDLFIFYIFFESVLIPILFIIGIWGSRERKIRAGYIFFLYTLFGSLFILFGLVVIYLEVGSIDYNLLLNYSFTETRQKLLWVAFFVSFAVKVPIFPFHIWLPEAHVEAPTVGSVILAGILLKLGTYGLVRFSLVLFPKASLFFTPLVYTLCVIAIIYTSLTAIRQTDIKRVIAYASVAHINITLVGLFSNTIVGLEGALFQIISHGLVSGALFICIGVIYDRGHSRLISYYSGLSQTIPIFILYFLFFTIANIALPGTSNFIGEFIILMGLIFSNPLIAICSALSLILGGCYSLWLFNRVAYGNIKNQYFTHFYDVQRQESLILFVLFFLVLFFGICPGQIIKNFHCGVANVIQNLKL